MIRKPSLPTKLIAVVLSAALCELSLSPAAWAAGANALATRGAAPAATAVIGPAGALGAPTAAGLGVLTAPSLAGSLPSLSLDPAVSAVMPAAAAMPLAVVPTLQPRSRAITPAAPRAAALRTASRSVGRRSEAIRDGLRAAENLDASSAESSRGLGAAIAAIAFGERSRADGEFAVNAADSRGAAGKLRFAKDWIDPAQAYEAVRRAARRSMRVPSVSYADADIERVGGELRVSAVRYGLVDTLSELAGRFSFVYKVDAKSPEGRFEELKSIWSHEGTGGISMLMIEPKIPLKSALRRLHRARPDFEPVRAALYMPSSIASGKKGLVYRFSDASGAVVEIDAATGRYDGNPILFRDPLGEQLKAGTVPAPTLKHRPAAMPSLEASNPWSVRLGGLGLAFAYTTTAFGISLLTGWPVVGAAFAVFFATGFAGFVTYVSALEIEHSRYGTEAFVTNPRRAGIGEAMLNAAILFGIGTMIAAFAAPAATAAAFLGLSGIVRRDAMVSPAALYERAYAEALAKADGVLHFGEAVVNSPVRDGDHWKFNFYSVPEAEDGKAKMISVDFHRGGGWVSSGGFYSKIRVYEDAALPADQPVFPISPETFAGSIKIEPETALNAALREAPGMRGAVSVSLRAEVEGENKERGDFRYRFYDNRGYEVSVNARTNEVRILQEPRTESREERLERFRMWRSLGDLDRWLGETLPLYKFLKWAAILGGLLFLADMIFDFPGMIGASGLLGAGPGDH
ncbi:MAG: hypothetical protein AUJ52_00580 [Elusimicrobia bacterium CG1_02_63_36]|nr:MAG: hypothetical protein AUJ52_00580 [Elusimicrobia bacterium CG1_02_63_36]PIP84318.1 MAG: hypothetical protein COR54_05050 [Elusimicrobia bacterium CG22_combo_CG10-13_8_21_14_all_63_91]PJA15687.1 MAG: hypothetical protein COX66_09620 [Elusimicrobia bacterium CG_4_10_14_0_2_um_filter_63_34]PJB23677.1 MAG: hypothetical protein CO113_17155 [Elusimicrobia bacterium CG_4_9_14_3_um_filter_62_55]